jgi:hypothetical protein
MCKIFVATSNGQFQSANMQENDSNWILDHGRKGMCTVHSSAMKKIACICCSSWWRTQLFKRTRASPAMLITMLTHQLYAFCFWPTWWRGAARTGWAGPPCDFKRVKLCIWQGNEVCVLKLGLPQPVAVLSWEVQPCTTPPVRAARRFRPTQMTSVGRG